MLAAFAQFLGVQVSAAGIGPDLGELRTGGPERRFHGRFAVFAQALLERGEQRERRDGERHDTGEQERGEQPRAQAHAHS